MSPEIYRFMECKYFFKMVENKELRFVHPSEWWKSLDRMELFGFGEQIKKTVDVQLKQCLYSAYSYHYAQSWSFGKDEYMWETFKKGNKEAVMVAVDFKKISELHDIIAMPVIYVEDVIDYISNNRCNNEDIIKSLCVKEKKFELEKEIRLIYQIRKTFSEYGDDIFRWIVSSNFGRNSKNKSGVNLHISQCNHRSVNLAEEIRQVNDKNDFIYISFSHVKKFISYVCYHPKADADTVNSLTNFCRNHFLLLKKWES